MCIFVFLLFKCRYGVRRSRAAVRTGFHKIALLPCIYYFGLFDNPQEAKLNQNGYIEDLISEQASGIYVEIKKCKPNTLTVYEEE
ncbi:MAG: DUF1816 domain-containing protein [Richelia sp. SL_2_1]|nr:DUF1816 domain-containing protein [Richelia sp. SL_2_1]